MRTHGFGLVAATVPVLLLLTSGPAAAHPFGPPQTVTIDLVRETGVVRVHWEPGAPDDYSYLAVGLGVSADDRTQQPGGLLSVKADADRLQASPLFPRYLTEHVDVRDDAGERCRGTVLPVEHLVADGADLTFDCGHPVDAADVRVSLLTDLHPSYRTMATGPFGQRFVYTDTATAHAWSSVAGPDSPGLGRSALVQLSLVGGALAAAAAAVLLTLRHVRTRRILPS